MEQPENNSIDAEPSAPSLWAGLGTRTLSAAVLASVALVTLWQGGWLWTLLVMIAAMLMVKEWNALTAHDGPLWHVAGLFYAAIPCASMIWLRDQPEAGFHLVLYLMLIVWATDIGAYFTGRRFGRRRLAPAISPGKTWEGLGGGVACAALTAAVLYPLLPYPYANFSFPVTVALAMMLALLAQAGDLFESWMKRRAGVKDSSTLIPGHGGLLDRIDGLTLTAPVFAVLVGLSGTAL